MTQTARQRLEGLPWAALVEKAQEELQASPEDPKRSVTYFISDGTAIKIGKSVAEKLQDRLAALQTAHHQKLEILASCTGGYATERSLHQVFQADRLAGEWFHGTPQLVKLAQRIAARPKQGSQILLSFLSKIDPEELISAEPELDEDVIFLANFWEAEDDGRLWEFLAGLIYYIPRSEASDRSLTWDYLSCLALVAKDPNKYVYTLACIADRFGEPICNEDDEDDEDYIDYRTHDEVSAQVDIARAELRARRRGGAVSQEPHDSLAIVAAMKAGQLELVGKLWRRWVGRAGSQAQQEAS